MHIQRRRLLQVTGAGCALAALPAVLHAASTTLRAYQVRDAAALPLFAAGDLVLADTAVTRFAGTGLYLYPAWGQPRLYRVEEAAKGLEFRNPGSGLLLWTQTGGLDAAFAGRVPEMPERPALVATYPALAVPALPLSA